MKLYFDANGNFENIVLELNNLDLANLLDLDGGTHAYVGSTSATGNAMEVHEVLTWEMCPYQAYPQTNIKEPFDNDKNNFIKVYPQPTADELVIEYSGKQGDPVIAELYDIPGEKLIQLK